MQLNDPAIQVFLIIGFLSFLPAILVMVTSFTRIVVVLSFLRQTADGKNHTVVILNLTPVARPNYRLGVPLAGTWKEVLNSDAAIYGGSNAGNCGGVTAENIPAHKQPASAEYFLPPLSVIVFQPEPLM